MDDNGNFDDNANISSDDNADINLDDNAKDNTDDSANGNMDDLTTLTSGSFAIYQKIILGWNTYTWQILLWTRRTPQPKANPTQ